VFPEIHPPALDIPTAVRLVREIYGLDASATSLPSERDQNFLLTTADDDRYVLKISNVAERRLMLEAQNAAMTHVARRVSFCPRVLPTRAGGLIGRTDEAEGGQRLAAPRGGVLDDGAHWVRLVTYLPGEPLAKAVTRSSLLLENVGRAVGQLDRALAGFDHPALCRAFHWNLANAASVIREYLPLVEPERYRQLIARVSRVPLRTLEVSDTFRCSAVHHDANDWNVLVDGDAVTGIIDFGDMVHGWTIADPAVAGAYAMLGASPPLDAFADVVRGYHAEHPLRVAEVGALWDLAILRLCMSACIAAWQLRQRPDDRYLAISQEPIRRTLGIVARIPTADARKAVKAACSEPSRRA